VKNENINDVEKWLNESGMAEGQMCEDETNENE
jgi:hypothetical protein